jgi:hypothetical protein
LTGAARRFSGGLFLLVYLALMFAIPVVETRDQWLAAMASSEAARGS